MALFKICRGNESNLPETLTDGYAYFCTDTGNFYIDWADSDGNVSREHISAEYATKLRYKDDSGEWVEIEAKDIANITVEQVQADFAEVDSSEPSFIKNKVVGYEPDIVAETTWTFASDGFYTYPKTAQLSGFAFEEGVEYIVTWDGVEYTCTATTYQYIVGTGTSTASMTCLAVGNPALFAVLAGSITLVSEANDLPFFINRVYNFTEDEGDHGVRIRLADNIIKLDKQFFPDDLISDIQANWKETDTTSSAYIQNKPDLSTVATDGYYNSLWGRIVGDIEPLFEDKTISFAQNEDFPSIFTRTVTGVPELILGEEYVVTWDGTEYPVTCKHVSEINSGLDEDENENIFYLGNSTIFWGAGYGEDTGEPFLLIWQRGSVYFSTYDTENSSHVVSVIPKNTVITLDEKYLPNGIATEEYVEQKISEIELSGGASFVQVQSDWDEEDDSSAAFIQNKPEILTAADVTAMLASAGVVVPVAVEDNLLLTDSDDDIYIL